jgi:hypothetical protein
MPFENDGVITWELLVERMNSDLANTLGNLVNRTISMANKYFGGVIERSGVTEEVDDDLKAVVLEAVKKVDAKMDELRVADALTELFVLFKQRHGMSVLRRFDRRKLTRRTAADDRYSHASPPNSSERSTASNRAES